MLYHYDIARESDCEANPKRNLLHNHKLKSNIHYSFVILWCIVGWFSVLWEFKADTAFVEL